jgi:hypothetical protein
VDDDYYEERASFVGPCTCPDTCPAQDDPVKHGWGSCDEDDCPCEAGWEE